MVPLGARGPQSLVFQEAENRLWAQMAVLVDLLGLAPAVAPFVTGIRESGASPQRQPLVKA